MAEVTAELKEIGDRLAGLTLKQAVDLASYLKETHGIEAAPKTVKEGLQKDEAEKLKKELEEQGATVELK